MASSKGASMSGAASAVRGARSNGARMNSIFVYIYEVQLVDESMRPCAEECCRCGTAPESVGEIVVVKSVNNVSTEISVRRLGSYRLHEWML